VYTRCYFWPLVTKDAGSSGENCGASKVKSLQYVIIRIAQTYFLHWTDCWEISKREKYSTGSFTLRLSENVSRTPLFNVTGPDCDEYLWKWRIFLEVSAKSLCGEIPKKSHSYAVNRTWEYFDNQKAEDICRSDAMQCENLENLWEIGPVYVYSRHFIIFESQRRAR